MQLSRYSRNISSVVGELVVLKQFAVFTLGLFHKNVNDQLFFSKIRCDQVKETYKRKPVKKAMVGCTCFLKY